MKMPGETKVFTEPQTNLLAEVMNRIIPAEDGLPGAGDLDLIPKIDATVGNSPILKKLFLEGLAQIEITSRKSEDKEFKDLSQNEKDKLLRDVEQERPDFFQALVQQTYRHYYTNPTIFPLIGYEGYPPQPKGHPMKPFDESLLDNVKKRGPLYKIV